MYWHGPLLAELTFRQMVASPSPDHVIYGYPEYGTDPGKLDARQQGELNNAAHNILNSLFTMNPIRAFVVVGHADKALRKPLGERAAFEFQVSTARANAARDALLRELIRIAGGPAVINHLCYRAVGIGNARPVFAHAANEAQMRKNRRIEIIFARSMLSKPSCRV